MFLNFQTFGGSRSASRKSVLTTEQTTSQITHFQQMLPPRRQSLPICNLVATTQKPISPTSRINWAYHSQLHPPLGPPKHPPRSPWVKTHWIFGEAEVDAAGGKKNKYPP